MEEINGATSTTLASAPSHDKALSMVVDADTARVAVPVQTLESFWTSCDKCGFQFEYEFKYLGHLMKCQMCSKGMYSLETPYAEMVGRAHKKNKCVVHKGEVAAKRLQALQPTENASVPESFHPIEGDGAFMKSGHKKKMKDLIKPPGADYKAADDDSFEKSPEPQGIPKEASPEAAVAELKKIPDLARDDFLKACNVLRRNDFEFRILVAFPMELKKEWLLKEIKKQNN
ncbi:hypothetical protein GQ55_6G167200 [Panicum hallii var. hallii]|uniref:Uncharacterized protein n=1 Tax=Panicum hallii var. hallii TaxID=1504633 RepID=A0A2T7D6N3_9POAL|nr:hypothetical protein GQ55_6G167200 [Panicum hallii var. hallii]